MNHLALLGAITLGSVAATAPAQPDTVRRFAVGGFDTIDLTGSDRVRVVVGSAVSVVATGDPRAVAALAITVRGTTLRVGRRSGNWHDNGALVTVTIPSLHAASISGSGNINAIDVTGSIFSGKISGSGGMALSGLRVVQARFDLSGSGSISANGHADSVSIDLGGSGSIDTRQLTTPDITISLGGSGQVTASATRLATVRTDGSGEAHITGGAHCDVRRGGTAIVRCG